MKQVCLKEVLVLTNVSSFSCRLANSKWCFTIYLTIILIENFRFRCANYHKKSLFYMHSLLVTCVSLWSSDVLQHFNLNAVFFPRALSTPGHLHSRCIFHCMSLTSFKISDGKNPKHSSQNFFSKSLWNLHSDVTALGNHVCLDYHKNMNVIVQHGFQSQWLLHSYTTTSVHQNNKVPYEYSTTWKLLWALEATLSYCLETISKPSSVNSTGSVIISEGYKTSFCPRLRWHYAV